MHRLPKKKPEAGESTWKTGMEYSLHDISKKLRMQEAMFKTMAERMQKIIDGEKELAQSEKLQRRLERKSRERETRSSEEDGYS